MEGSLLQHTTREGERWDVIAYRYYGNALSIGGLIAANPHLPLVETFPAGWTVWIPVLPAKPFNQADMPPWLR